MGGRKDLSNKRQLSIIDETDYFSDEGQLQGHASHVHTSHEEVNISQIILENKLDASATSLDRIIINNNKSETNNYRRDDASYEPHSHWNHKLNTGHYLDDSRQNQMAYDRTMNSGSSLIPHSFTKSPKNLIKPNTKGFMATSCGSLKTITEIAFSGDDVIKTRNCYSLGTNVCNSGKDVKSNGSCESCLKSQFCQFANDFNGNEAQVHIQCEFNQAIENVQESNIESVHEMFQVLIKSIEGTHFDKRFRYNEGESEESCKSSPLLYLMDEKVEKQAQGVDNIISSFKEKFSLPNSNSKRPPVRQKSWRNLAQGNLEEKPSPEKDKSNFISVEKDNLSETYLRSQSVPENELQMSVVYEPNHGVSDTSEIPQYCQLEVDVNAEELQDENSDITKGSKVTSNMTSVSNILNKHREQQLNTLQNSDIEECFHQSHYDNDSNDNYNNKNNTNNNNINNKVHIPPLDNDQNKELYESTRDVACEMEDDQALESNEPGSRIFENEENISLIVPSLKVPSFQFTVIDSNSCELNISKVDTDKDNLESDLNCNAKERKLLPQCTQKASEEREQTETNTCVEKMPIPIFKRDGPKPYEDDDIEDCWNYPPQMHTSQNQKSTQSAKETSNFLTVPNALQVPSQNLNMMPLSTQDQKQPSLISPNSSTSPATSIIQFQQAQQSKAVTFLNSNGSIPKRPMLRHVSQPNMNAHITPTFPGSPCAVTNNGQLGADASTHSPTEGKFQTKDLNSDLAKLKATAVRLNLVTRRPSYLEWLEERRKNRPLLVLGMLDSRHVKDSDNSLSKDDLPGDEMNQLIGATGPSQTWDPIHSVSSRRRLVAPSDASSNSESHTCDSSGSSRRGSSCSNCSGGDKDNDANSAFSDSEATNADDDETDTDDSANSPRNKRRLIGTTDFCPHFKRLGNGGRSNERLTAARKDRINKSLEWLRTELKTMRSQDQALARQLLTLRHEMHKLRLSWSCQEHRDLLDEVQCELEDFQEFSKVLDLPSTVYLDTPLKNVGVTRLNISARRFSTC